MEVDISKWKAGALPPLAQALSRNTAFLALKAADAPVLGNALGSLGACLASNERLLVLALERW